MGAEDPREEDPVLRRVTAVRPPVPEEDLSPDSAHARAIVERVLAGPAPTPERRSPWRRGNVRWTLPRVGLALSAVGVLAAVTLFLAGTFSGPDSSGTQPAVAAVIRTARSALSPSPGSIFVEDEAISGPGVHGHPYTLHEVLETPARGPQNQLLSSDDSKQFSGRDGVTDASYIGGTEEIYLPSTHTVYESSIWSPYLHPGSRPNTFVYRYAPGAPAYATRPVPVTASQRRKLLTGQDCIRLTSKIVEPTINGRKVKRVKILGLRVLPPLRGPAEDAMTLQQALASRHLHLVGRRRVDGRDAVELAAHTTDATAPELRLYFDPRTRLPFEELDSVGTPHEEVIHLLLRKLPITPASERLLSLPAQHPTARVDRRHEDYVHAAHGLQVFPQ